MNLLNRYAADRREQFSTATTIACLNIKMQALSNGIGNLQELKNNEIKSSDNALFTALMPQLHLSKGNFCN